MTLNVVEFSRILFHRFATFPSFVSDKALAVDSLPWDRRLAPCRSFGLSSIGLEDNSKPAPAVLDEAMSPGIGRKFQKDPSPLLLQENPKLLLGRANFDVLLDRTREFRAGLSVGLGSLGRFGLRAASLRAASLLLRVLL